MGLIVLIGWLIWLICITIRDNKIDEQMDRAVSYRWQKRAEFERKYISQEVEREYSLIRSRGVFPEYFNQMSNELINSFTDGDCDTHRYFIETLSYAGIDINYVIYTLTYHTFPGKYIDRVFYIPPPSLYTDKEIRLFYDFINWWVSTLNANGIPEDLRFVSSKDYSNRAGGIPEKSLIRIEDITEYTSGVLVSTVRFWTY